MLAGMADTIVRPHHTEVTIPRLVHQQHIQVDMVAQVIILTTTVVPVTQEVTLPVVQTLPVLKVLDRTQQVVRITRVGMVLERIRVQAIPLPPRLNQVQDRTSLDHSQ